MEGLELQKDSCYIYNLQKGYEYLIKLIKKYNLEKKIVLLEPVERKKIPSYLLAADYIIIPSLTEGFGFTTVEACMMGKPIIATNISSIPEVAFGKVIFIEPSNPTEIKKGIEKALKGEFEIINKKTFSKQKFIENYEEEYKKLL